MTDPVLRLLREQPRLAEMAAAYPFEFDLDRAEHGEAVCLASGASLEPMAGDGAGGTYFVCGGADGPVLYASSEGTAGLIGGSVSEALEIVIGLPDWRDHTGLSPADGEEAILAAVAASENELQEFMTDLDDRRTELRTALGLPERSTLELFTMFHRALLRTEPEHLLLNTDELLAYELLDPHPRTPLRETVLAPGRADLARMRVAGRGAWDEVAADAVRRATVLRAAQYDRQDSDLPLLRHLLEREATDTGYGDELRLAAVLVGRYGSADDVPLLRGALRELPEEPVALAEWARELDAERFGEDPSAAPELTWVALARRQGRTEHARAALIRMLDDTGPDAPRLRGTAAELALLGEFGQAARAQYNVTSLQDTAWGRASAGLALAAYERSAGNLSGACRTLERVVGALEPTPATSASASASASASDHGPAPGTGTGTGPDQLELDLGLQSPAAEDQDAVPDWRRRRRFGGLITEEYLLLALAAAETGDASLAREAMSHGRTLLKEIAEPSRKALGPLAQEAKWAVARLPR
ncbi:hypothetical protein ACWGI8_11525 [Streptomyces sp. NPDC054841]